MNQFIQFLKESYDEMRHKVTWPTYKSLQQNSVIVLIASLIFALVIGAMDYGFKSLMQLVYSSL